MGAAAGKDAGDPGAVVGHGHGEPDGVPGGHRGVVGGLGHVDGGPPDLHRGGGQIGSVVGGGHVGGVVHRGVVGGCPDGGGGHRDLHSFPTRRSSDLAAQGPGGDGAGGVG